MSDAPADTDVVLGAPGTDVRALYEHVAERYDRFRGLWLSWPARPPSTP